MSIEENSAETCRYLFAPGARTPTSKKFSTQQLKSKQAHFGQLSRTSALPCDKELPPECRSRLPPNSEFVARTLRDSAQLPRR